MHVSGVIRIRILIILVLILIVWQVMKYWNDLNVAKNALLITSGAPIVISIYYEALCPDSKHFIIKQLQTTNERIPQLIHIDLIPYGKATTSTKIDGELEFSCQHGTLECKANIIHACCIESITDSDTRLNVIACMIKDNMIPEDAFNNCANKYSIEIEQIKKCYQSPHGAELLKVHGEKTNTLRPKMTFVPTITLDGMQNNQAYILKDLFTEVCKVAGGRGTLPSACQ